MYIDYLIIGQGLAGSVLAEHCLQKGLKIKIMSLPTISTASLVAGGLYNPITGRKMVKTWNCDALFNYLTPFYKALDEKLSIQSFHERPIYRPFLDIEAQNEWMGKSAEDSYAPYIHKSFAKSAYEFVQDQYGGILLRESGYLDTQTFVERYRAFLNEQKGLLEERFEAEVLEINKEGIRYNDIKAKGVIFCEGTAVTQNPLFNWLPFRPVKGELLTIKSSHVPEVIYNRGVFVIGKSECLSTVGATYDHQDLTLRTTERAKSQLIEKLDKLINYDYEIIDQKVGIRPATKDRRPIIGQHPKMKNVYIFNGMGAKGVSLAPFYANQFTDYLIHRTNLDDEVNIERYFSLF